MDISNVIQLKPEEEVLEVVRESLAPHIPKFLLITLWFITPFFFMFPLFREGWFGVLFFLALIISAVVVGMRTYIKWKNTVFVITDRRIVDIEQKGLFDRVVSEVPFSLVDDVTYRVKGIFPTIFRFGLLVVRTTGNAADLEFRRATSPARLHDLINDLREAMLDEERDRKKEKIEKMAQSMSVEEIRELARHVRRKEQKEAMEEFFEEE